MTAAIAIAIAAAPTVHIRHCFHRRSYFRHGTGFITITGRRGFGRRMGVK